MLWRVGVYCTSIHRLDVMKCVLRLPGFGAVCCEGGGLM